MCRTVAFAGNAYPTDNHAHPEVVARWDQEADGGLTSALMTASSHRLEVQDLLVPIAGHHQPEDMSTSSCQHSQKKLMSNALPSKHQATQSVRARSRLRSEGLPQILAM